MFFIVYVLGGRGLDNLNKAAVHFLEIEYSTAVKGLPHSKQQAFRRDVINPQEGHILCDWNPMNCGFSLCLQWSNRIATSTISRPKETLVAFIGATLLGELYIDPASRSIRVLKWRT
jgi:hypothetical protein